MNNLFDKETERFHIRLKASPDNVKLFIDLAPVGGAAPSPAITREEVLTSIESAVKVKEPDLAVIDDVIKYVNRGEAVTERRIKKGREPEEGEPGKLLLLIKALTAKADMQEDEKGRVVLTSMHLFDNVRSGQIVARIYPPKPGKDGEDVFGKSIPAKAGAPVKVKVDKTLRIEESAGSAENFQKIVATLDGYLTEESLSLAIHDELFIKGDVDFHYGNIDFIGHVTVSGDVHPSFVVTARKGLVVQGGVQECRLRASEGDVEIKGFAFGGKGSSIVSGRGIIGNVMHEVVAEAVSNIVVTKEAIDCVLRTQSIISMPKARLIGGKALCVCGLEAKEIGNPAGQETFVTLANSVEVSTEYCQLLVQIANHEQAIKLIELHLGPYAHNTARVQLLSPNHRSRIEALLRKRKEVEDSRVRLLGKKKGLLEAGRGNREQRVSYYDAVYPGTHVLVGEHMFSPQEKLQGPGTIEFNQETKEFVVGEFKAIECDVTGGAAKVEADPRKGEAHGK